MAGSWFRVWVVGEDAVKARRLKAESLEQAACKEARRVMDCEDSMWTFYVQRCGTTSVYEVEVKQTIERTARVVKLAEGVDRG